MMVADSCWCRMDVRRVLLWSHFLIPLSDFRFFSTQQQQQPMHCVRCVVAPLVAWAVWPLRPPPPLAAAGRRRHSCTKYKVTYST